MSTGVAIMLAGLLLDRYVGLAPGLAPQAAEQSALTVSRLAMAYSVTPAVLFLAAALLMRRYALTRPELPPSKRICSRGAATEQHTKED